MALPRLEHPVFTLELPSTGNNIKYRPFLVKEEKLLLIMEREKDVNIIDVIKRLVQSCIIDEDVDVGEFAIFDLIYVFLNIRSKSVSGKLDFRLPCQNKDCKKLTNISVPIEEIKVTGDMPDKLIVLDDKLSISMKCPTVDMFVGINDKDEADLNWDLIIDCIDKIYMEDEVFNPKDESKDEQIGFLESLGQNERNKISSFLENTPKVKKEIKFSCPSCEHENVYVMESLEDFFTYLSPI